jgi:hypothetical protein
LLNFLKSPAVLAATGLTVFQGVLLYSAVRPEAIPPGRPLSQMPTALGSWELIQEGVVDADTQAILKADDLLNRYYARGATGANLFVAAFRSQRNGKAPHSPKNCLPGNGWTPVISDEISIDPGMGGPITVNLVPIAGPRGCERVQSEILGGGGCDAPKSHGHRSDKGSGSDGGSG